MFVERDLSSEVTGVRAAHAPGALVVDCERDFETLDPAVAEELGLRVDTLDPLSYPGEWVPTDAPDALHRLASGEFTIGMPGDGGVTWTRQTEPPAVFVKARTRGSPASFLSVLVAEALVEAGGDRPETFLGFFEAGYRDLDAAVPLGPADTYQLAAALYDAYVGLHTRPTFESWADEFPGLHEGWDDAGERLAPRVGDLPGEVATGRTEFAPAAELACSGIKHGLDLPAPFVALDTAAYRQHGASYAIQWAEKTFQEPSD
jgi:hypothetical protein